MPNTNELQNFKQVKKIILNIILLFLTLFANAQTRDLNYYLEQAKTNSPLINKANNNNKLIQLDMQKVKSILNKPIVSIEGNLLFSPIISHDNGNQFQWVSEGANSYTGYDLAYSDGGQYQAYISVKQPLFLGKTYKSYSEQADIQTRINENNITLTQHELEQLVSRQYILCEMAKEQGEISKSLLDKLNEQVQIMQKLVENAIYKQTDLMLLQIETENFNIEYEKYWATYKQNISDLNLLCGISDTTTIEIKNIELKITEDTLTNSQFLNKYTLDSLNIIAKQTLFEQKYRPQLSVFANAGMNAIYLPSYNRLGFATGLTFSWNIFDGNQKKIQFEKSFIEMQTISFEKQNFINQHNTNKEKYLNQIETIDRQIKIVEKQLTEYEKLIKLYKYELQQGQVSIMDVKNIIRDVSAKRQENLRLKMQKQMLINSYNYWNY